MIVLSSVHRDSNMNVAGRSINHCQKRFLRVQRTGAVARPLGRAQSNQRRILIVESSQVFFDYATSSNHLVVGDSHKL
jgi:hypothetical protein